MNSKVDHIHCKLHHHLNHYQNPTKEIFNYSKKKRKNQILTADILNKRWSYWTPVSPADCTPNAICSLTSRSFGRFLKIKMIRFLFQIFHFFLPFIASSSLKSSSTLSFFMSFLSNLITFSTLLITLIWKNKTDQSFVLDRSRKNLPAVYIPARFVLALRANSRNRSSLSSFCFLAICFSTLARTSTASRA